VKKARIVSFVPRDANGDEMVSELRAGAKGKGRVLASVRFWPWSAPSCKAADRILAAGIRQHNVEIVEEF
jgi:hypothetical protein